jgi:hypothetical protein
MLPALAYPRSFLAITEQLLGGDFHQMKSLLYNEEYGWLTNDWIPSLQVRTHNAY